ncbi:DUF1566 domain-containing protein [Arenibacter sp. F20364]|uniref:Lcl C-terminal domain-containing protein n=1 Tax=Arenibacter sp. F20364 TaxID=2926415 RepID=UPI001FF3B733|nr:DUF1566 domain-containing protein [Arenibacter sp. F20364]MCK0192871.1 DUF1566 domain-containing protein [Arenibacter sp. F20364]
MGNLKSTSVNMVGKLTLIFLSVLLIQSCNIKKKSEEKEASVTTSSSNNYTQIATGQVALYTVDGEVIESLEPSDSLYGQDANYLKGKKMSYKKNGDGTVIDLNSGLMWQEIPTTEGFDWNGAKEYCENLELGGYDDWRMPTLKELFSISDFSSGWPYLDSSYFSLVNNDYVEKSEQYWADNKYVGHTEEGRYTAAFGVNHATGHIKAYPGEAAEGGMRNGPPLGGNNGSEGQDSEENRPPPPGQGKDNADGNRPMGNPMLKHVRAVRGNIYGINNFKDNGDGTITDTSTGLMWSKKDSQEGLDWKNALVYSENTVLAGHSDWRLPNVKELQGIVDYHYAPSAKDTTLVGAAIDPLFSCSEIINENDDKDYPYYWTSTSARFQKGKPYYYAWYVAFGRAVNPKGLDFHGAGAVRFDTKHENGPAGEGGERIYNYVRLVRNVD